MSKIEQVMAWGTRILLVAAVCEAAQCQHQQAGAGPHGGSARTAGLADAGEIKPEELRGVLADLARAHQQKVQLAWWVGAPLLRPLGPAFKPFYQKMGQQQAELLKDLQAWAKANQVDLTFRYADDTAGRALKIMEDRQEKLVRSDSQTDFERDMLMQEYSDFEWQVSVIQALLPRVKEAGLRGYLEKSLKVHLEGSAEILGLLKRFRFTG